ncbi:hypothetical protein NMY22_g13270 [Coprinellus aureogranulatus]|nr:hypothetical protein NMY22_g13270 [Coprinellus aureogranulatus]
MGNLRQLFDIQHGLAFHESLSSSSKGEYGGGGVVKVYGFFGDEQLYVSDPRAIACVLGKDSREGGCFDETGVFLECNRLIFGPGLVSTSGAQHKRQRKLALPMFSHARIRAVEHIFWDIAVKLTSVLERQVLSQTRPPAQTHAPTTDGKEKENVSSNAEGTLDMSTYSSRVSLEAAGRAILGFSFDPLDSPVVNPYTKAIESLIPTLFSLSLLRTLTPFLVRLLSLFSRLFSLFSRLLFPFDPYPEMGRWVGRWVVERIPSRRVRSVRESADVMDECARGILDERRWAHRPEGDMCAGHDGQSDDGTQQDRPKDITSMLLKANTSSPPHLRMSDAELTGQMTVLIFGASDTTSSALSRVFYQLAANPTVQEKVRDEIREVYHAGRMEVKETGEDVKQAGEREGEQKRLTPEGIEKLVYLDAVIKETLRMYPPVPFVRRICTQDTSIPYKEPSTSTLHKAPSNSDGNPTSIEEEERNEVETLAVPKGTTLFLSVLGYNRNTETWGEDAGEWRPERWLSTGKPYKEDVKVPGSYLGMLTFLGGGRSCVGSRFALSEMKIILAIVLSKMYFKPTLDPNEEIVWNLAQIISPSVRRKDPETGEVVERKGLPLVAVLDDLTV